MELTFVSFQPWAISVIQIVLCLISLTTLAAFFIGPAKPRSPFRALLRLLGRSLTLLFLAGSTIRLLEAGRAHLLGLHTAQAYDLFHHPRIFASAAGREPIAGCFNFTSQALDHYQVLHVARDVPQARIRSAYTKLARVCHPDKLRRRARAGAGAGREGVGVGVVVSPEAADINYRRLRLAYDGLRDERARCMYDCDTLVPASGRAVRGRDRMRCVACAGATMWDLMAEMVREDFNGGGGGGGGGDGFGTASASKKKKKAAAGKKAQQQQQQQQEKPRADQVYEWDLVATYARPGAIGSVVRAAAEETGLVLHRIALYAVSKAHGWVDVLLHGSPLGRLVRRVMRMGMEEVVIPVRVKLAKLWH